MIDVIGLHIDFSVIFFEILHLHYMFLVHGICVPLCMQSKFAGVYLVKVIHDLVSSSLKLLFGHSFVL